MKLQSKNKFSYSFYHIGKYYNGELKTYWENGQIKRHDVFADGIKKSGSTWAENGMEVKYYEYEVSPQFPGGYLGLSRFLSNTIKYPKIAKENGIQGRVVVSFDIEKDGSIKNIKIENSIAKILDEEAIRIINLMPNWTPGKQDGENVRVSYKVPINFQTQ